MDQVKKLQESAVGGGARTQKRTKSNKLKSRESTKNDSRETFAKEAFKAPRMKVTYR